MQEEFDSSKSGFFFAFALMRIEATSTAPNPQFTPFSFSLALHLYY
jgi:hypothetical protein